MTHEQLRSLPVALATPTTETMTNPQRPFKYFVICNKTHKVVLQTNITPIVHNLQTFEPTEDPNIMELKQTKTAYIDTRYEARLRLYNYITYTKKRLPVPRYNPFSGTEIGKSTPILNF